MRLKTAIFILAVIFVALVWVGIEANAQTIVTGAPGNLLTTQSGTATATINWFQTTWKAPSAGWYRITTGMTVAVVGTAGTYKPTVACGTGSNDTAGIAQPLTGLGTSSTATITCKMAAGDQFWILVTFSGATGSPSVPWKAWIERMP